MPEPRKYAARVSDKGELQIAEPLLWKVQLGRLRGQVVYVTVEGFKTTRSLAQNRRYWGMILPLAADVLSAERPVPFSSEQAHEVLKMAFLGHEDSPLGPVARSTRKLSVEAFSKFCTDVEHWLLHSYGVMVPARGGPGRGVIEFEVYGVPVPKGSTKAFFRPGMKYPVVTHDNAKTKPWQEAIVCAAREAGQGRPPADGPVALLLKFYMPRPKSAPRYVRLPVRKPDLDKLVRCVKDGLTRAGLYRDDSQVVEVVASKRFAGGEHDILGLEGVPRVHVQARPWP